MDCEMDTRLPLPAFASIADACKLTGISRSRIYELLADGQVKARKMGVRTLIDVGSIVAYVNTLPEPDIRPRAPRIHPLGIASGCG